MKNQALYSSKDNSKKLKCRLLQFFFGALRVKWSNKQNYPGIVIKTVLKNPKTTLRALHFMNGGII